MHWWKNVTSQIYRQNSWLIILYIFLKQEGPLFFWISEQFAVWRRKTMSNISIRKHMYNVSKILSKIFRIDCSTLYIQHGTPICAPEILELLRLVRAIGSTCAVLFLAAPNIPTPYFTTSCIVVLVTDRLFAQCSASI